MNEKVEIVVRTVAIGAGATLVVDAWGLALRRLGVPSLSMAHLGRWIGHLPDGQLVHDGVARAAPVRGEVLIGWGAHYVIGIAFAALLLALSGLRWARSPTLLPALVLGVVTVVAPLFVLQPALGAGVASTRTASPVLGTLKSLGTHTIFGLGLYLAARATAWLLPAGRP